MKLIIAAFLLLSIYTMAQDSAVTDQPITPAFGWNKTEVTDTIDVAIGWQDMTNHIIVLAVKAVRVKYIYTPQPGEDNRSPEWIIQYYLDGSGNRISPGKVWLSPRPLKQ